MSWKLELIRSGLNAARACVRRGQKDIALTQVKAILKRPNIPPSLAADAHRLAAEIEIDKENFVQARRQLRQAARYSPEVAEIHYLLGISYESDPYTDDYRAAIQFRKASRLQPSNSLFLAAFGRAAIRFGKTKLGIRTLKKVAQRAAADRDVIRIVVNGLIEADHPSTARGIAIKARFLKPDCAEIRILCERARYAVARLEQERAGRRHEATLAMDGDVPLLPFLKVVPTIEDTSRCQDAFIRRDVLSMPKPHLTRFRMTRADR